MTEGAGTSVTWCSMELADLAKNTSPCMERWHLCCVTLVAVTAALKAECCYSEFVSKGEPVNQEGFHELETPDPSLAAWTDAPTLCEVIWGQEGEDEHVTHVDVSKANSQRYLSEGS